MRWYERAMSDAFPVTIYHNPNCGTSRTVLGMIEAAGHALRIVEYRKTGWTRVLLDELLAAMDAGPRDILRAKEPLAAELGLLGDVSGDALLDAMVAHPVLVDRPIVVTPKGTLLCRPADRVQELL